MRIRIVFLTAALLLLSAGALAEGTRTWSQSSYDDFERGSATGVAVASDGALFLAPSFRALTTTPSTYLWSIASDDEGNVYAAAGSPARVYRITPQGAIAVIFQGSELQVQAVRVAPNGVVYAATSPDGKVYRIEHGKDPSKSGAVKPGADASVDPSWRSSVYFDPATKYIWDLALDAHGRLYVATGDHGQVFRVDAAGKGSVFFTSDEAHIRCLAFDDRGDLIAGSDGSGLVYRVAPDGNAFVLYSAAKKEITALAVAPDGSIYAAGVGTKMATAPATQPGKIPAMFPAPVSGPAISPATSPGAADQPKSGDQGKSPPGGNPGDDDSGAASSAAGAAAAAQAASMMSATNANFGADTSSEIYRIAPDGTPQRVWSSNDALVYALAFDAQGDLVAGTGNSGHVFAIRNQHQFADLVKASANQVISFAKAPGGGLYVGTSNLAKVFTLGAAPDAEGSFVSDVFDARIFSRWGRAELRGTGLVDLYARSGNVDNPDRNWSPWQKIDLANSAELTVPPARFVQWKVVMRPGLRTASVDRVGVNYRPNNVPPVVDSVSAQVGYRFVPPPRVPGVDTSSMLPTLTKDRGSIAVRWNAADDDDDDLVFSVYYRGDGETDWKLLKDRLTDKYYTFDSTALPDGGYTLKVLASDAPSHSPEEAMTTSDASQYFEIDNTPPLVENLFAVADAGHIQVTFHATDTFSPIKRAEYSIDGGDWQFLEPVGLLSDAKLENYDFAINLPPAPATDRGAAGIRNAVIVDRPAPPTEHSVVVRVYDRFDNMGSAKAIVRTR